MAEECVQFECEKMLFDIFFSISQTPDTSGYIPSENEMFSNFFEQVELADELGFGVGWVAQAHLSTEIQKKEQNTSGSSLPWRSWIVYRLLPNSAKDVRKNGKNGSW